MDAYLRRKRTALPDFSSVTLGVFLHHAGFSGRSFYRLQVGMEVEKGTEKDYNAKDAKNKPFSPKAFLMLSLDTSPSDPSR